MATPRDYPFGVWVRLSCGLSWMFGSCPTLDAALTIARDLRQPRTGLPLWPERLPVWIAAPPRIGRQASRARFRRTGA
jgi:hypothetical protein